jgi:hypothetical protein
MTTNDIKNKLRFVFTDAVELSGGQRKAVGRWWLFSAVMIILGFVIVFGEQSENKLYWNKG